MSTENLFAIGVGLGLRSLLDTVSPHNYYQTSVLVGLWEGAVLNHFSTNYPNSVDHYLAYGFRIFVDFIFTASLVRLMMVVLWTGLGMLLADVTLQLAADRRFRRLWRSSRKPSTSASTVLSSPTRSSRVRFHENTSTAGSYTSTTLTSPVTPPAPAVPLRPTTTPVPGRFDPWSEASGSVRSPPMSESASDRGLYEPETPRSPPARPRTPSELEYISLPVIPDSNDPAPTTSRPPSRPRSAPRINTGDPRPPAEEDGDNVKSGLTTPISNPSVLGRGVDEEDRPRIHSGLTTPEHARSPALALSSIPPPITAPDPGPEKPKPAEGKVPVRLTLAESTPIAFPEPQLTPMPIPPESEIPNIPTPDDHATRAPPGDAFPRDSLGRTPPPSFQEAINAAEVVGAGEDLESLVDQASVISGERDKSKVILKADELRKQAIEREKERDRIRQELNKAKREKRWFDAVRLEVDLERAQEAIDKAHASAARRYYHANNLERQPHEVDVHRLTTVEAITQIKNALRMAMIASASELRIICGKGNHSKDKVAVLKPAIIKEMKDRHIETIQDPKNAGVLVIKLPNLTS